MAPGDPRGKFYRGVALVLKKENPEEAERLLREYAKKAPMRSGYPRPAAAHAWLGRLFEDQNKMEEAIKEFESALELDPKNKMAHEALKRHPWAATMLMSPGRLRPARIAYMEALLACLRGAGLSADTTYHAYHVLDAHIIGFSLWASTHGKMPEHIEDARAWFDENIPVATLPYLHEHGLQHLDEGPHHDVSAFEFALDLLLGGFERLQG